MADSIAVFPPGFRLPDTNGRPIPGAQIEFYAADTDDPLEVFADSALTASLGSIVYTDSAGHPVTALNGTTKTAVFVGVGDFKVVLRNTSGVVCATYPRLPGAVAGGGGGGGGGSGITQGAADLRYIRNANALSALANLADADLIPFFDASGSNNKAIRYDDLVDDLIAKFATVGASMPSGTRIPFQQTNPPTGYTKESGAAYENAAFRLTTGTVGTGGSLNFSSAFATRSLGGSVGSFTLSTSDIPAHTHTANDVLTSNSLGTRETGAAGEFGNTVNRVTTSVGGSTGHSHPLTLNDLNLNVKFASFTIGIRN